MHRRCGLSVTQKILTNTNFFTFIIALQDRCCSSHIRHDRHQKCQVRNMHLPICGGFPGGTVVKNQPANAGDTKDVGLIGLGRSPGAENATCHFLFFLINFKKLIYLFSLEVNYFTIL